MISRKRPRADMLQACAEPGAEDGKDPRYDRPEGANRVPNRKALQLCGQVARTLAGILAYECGDEVLRNLVVASVVPAPTSARLLVTLHRPPDGTVELEAVAQRLEKARPMLRCQVAAAIHRRKTPDLIFRVE